MIPSAIGVFAHVDAGKTTFCEALLAATGSLAAPGRVDHRNTLLDHDELERRRGITIYSDIAHFTHGGRPFYLVDTPGHVDFAAETERVLSILDAAILLVSAPDGVQGHTQTLYRLLRKHEIPVYFFINKVDQAGADVLFALEGIRQKLSANCLLVEEGLESPAFLEQACEFDDALMEQYLADKPFRAGYTASRLADALQTGRLHLAAAGSALYGKGIGQMLDLLCLNLPEKKPEGDAFAARVFKVRYDESGNRLTMLRVQAGIKRVRDEMQYPDGSTEKINEIRAYQGRSYQTVTKMEAGDIVGVTGLACAEAGQGFGCEPVSLPSLRPTLRVGVQAMNTPYSTLSNALLHLEAQDPLLRVKQGSGAAELCVMGEIQLEVLKETLSGRFGIDAVFGAPHIVYAETVAAPVMGYGHFEPLRHYAEAHLRLEPNPGKGVAFTSEVHTDVLPAAFQRQISHTLLDETHTGLLTGSPLTDIRFVLTAGAHHLKHTSGGDMRQATRRAVRQALEKAQNTLLEPWYRFIIEVGTPKAGRVLSDITRLKGEFEPPVSFGDCTQIHGRAPVETFLSYPVELGILTGGTGSVSLVADGWHPCHDSRRIIQQTGYEKDRDLENPSSSVFCAHGAGFEVKWHEAERYMHLL